MIPLEAKGLLGLIRDTGRKLGERLKNFEKGDFSTRVSYHYDGRSNSGGLEWAYRVSQYEFSGGFSLAESNETSEVIIDGFQSVSIENGSNWARPTARPIELRKVADISEDVTKFLVEEFGESTSKRGNGCPLYKTKLPEKYRDTIEARA